MRGKNGKPTHEVVKSLGRMKSKEDWEWAESVLEAMKKEEKVPEAKDLKIEQQFELGGIWAEEELWRDCGIREALMESIKHRKVEFKFERIVLLLAVNRLYEPSSDLSAHRWINERVYPPAEVEY
ncbi:hypothetical protein AKJ65_04375 [candidate division MSBL1 archaeon SCGC-AAA259E19]|uniref:Uncharacterized protein n=1 Tax=candidate division MSBL1 archaeon SCGC-AAA259E19 TaxID=1698264 RepID=A0A133UJS5_9EURY|nr:hypothetical protein AKJ65_04375 [candidate division MSBL1 archaeon SCGC-AAA259E19]